MSIIYLFTFGTFAVLAFHLARRKGFLYFPVFFYGYLAVFHALVPVMAFSEIDPTRLNELDEKVFSHLFYIYSAAILFPLGWWLGGRTPKAILDVRFRMANDVAEEERARKLAWVFLAVGAVGFFLYFLAFGGIVSAISVAREYRTGLYILDNPFSFMRPIGDFAKISALVFLAVFIARSGSVFSLLGLVVSTLLSFLMLFFQGGRLSLALFVAILFFMFAVNHRLSSIKIAMSLGLMFLLLYFGYPLLYFVYEEFSGVQREVSSVTENLSPLGFIVKEFSFAYFSVNTATTAIETGTIKLRYGFDVIIGLLSIIPSRIFNLGVPHIGVLHTEAMTRSDYVSVPVDLLTYGVYSFGLVGPMIFAFIVGVSAKYLTRYLCGIAWPVVRYAFLLIVLLNVARTLVYFNPAAAINSLYFLIIASVIVYVISRKDSAIRRRRPKRPRHQVAGNSTSELSP